MDKIAVKQITLTRAEGPVNECGKPVTVDGWASAGVELRKWADSAPERGGYDKCDFLVEFVDGETYLGRYDLKHWRLDPCDLRGHVRGFVDFYCGTSKPHHMTEESYAAFMAQQPASQTADFRTFRERYDI